MKNNIKSMHAVCLVACLMALLNVDYKHLSGLDIAVLVSAAAAAVTIIVNVILQRKGGSK